jgi:hypothetical protein
MEWPSYSEVDFIQYAITEKILCRNWMTTSHKMEDMCPCLKNFQAWSDKLSKQNVLWIIHNLKMVSGDPT